jgi:hypothetical protein
MSCGAQQTLRYVKYVIIVEASLIGRHECKGRHVLREEETRKMTGGEEDIHKTNVRAFSKYETWIHEQMCSNPETEHLDVAHNQYRFRPTATEKR